MHAPTSVIGSVILGIFSTMPFISNSPSCALVSIMGTIAIDAIANITIIQNPSIHMFDAVTVFIHQSHRIQHY